MTAVWIVTALFAVIGGAAFFFASLVIHPRTFSLEKSYSIEVEKGHLVEGIYNSWEKRELAVRSPHGYEMRATWLPLAGSRKAVIIAHGFTYTRYGSSKYIESFRFQGYSALIVDLRYHGATGGRNSTFGYFEKDDLVAWTDWVFAELGPGARVGTHGESMGAGTVIQHAAIDPRLSFVVADCPFSELKALLAYRLREDFHLPSFPLMGLSNALISRLSGGMRLEKVSPLKAVVNIRAPVLFIHGEADGYIPPAMSVAMHEARLAAGLPSSLYLAPGADHAMSFDADPAEYRKRIAELLALCDQA